MQRMSGISKIEPLEQQLELPSEACGTLEKVEDGSERHFGKVQELLDTTPSKAFMLWPEALAIWQKGKLNYHLTIH